MLSGVTFRQIDGSDRNLEPQFVNQYVLTDMYLASKSMPYLRAPILPSLSIPSDPLASVFSIMYSALRSIVLILWSHLAGSVQPIRNISVANTSILYHDRRALATCQSGPPMRITLPQLTTVDWFHGKSNNAGSKHKTNKTH